MNFVKIFKKLDVCLKGNVAVKVHSGEKDNQNYLKPGFVKDIIERVGEQLLNVILLMMERDLPEQDRFLEARSNIAYINIMMNMSIDCDCCAKAEDPCVKDIGILASINPVALDKACLDLIYNSTDPGKDHLIERIESRNGTTYNRCCKTN